VCCLKQVLANFLHNPKVCSVSLCCCADIDTLDPENPSSVEDHDRIHILESCVVTWTKQIKNVLKSDPDEPLKHGLHVGPETEVNFWTERANNLNSIHEQLLGDSVQKIVTVLKLSHSTYHPAYLRLAEEVEKAKARANDNVKFLAPLKPRLEKVLYRYRASSIDSRECQSW
jgi:dynein heavy chain, axonemal